MNAFSYVIGIAILILIGGGVYFYTASPTEAPAITDTVPAGSGANVGADDTPIVGDSMEKGDEPKKDDDAMESGATGSTGGTTGGSNTTAGTAQKPTPKTVTVNYTKNGYSPASVDINVGDTVKWVSDGAPMWTASAMHPTHEIYPEFDQKKAGNTYEFTFTKAGSWKYHNHVSANHFGTVNVK